MKKVVQHGQRVAHAKYFGELVQTDINTPSEDRAYYTFLSNVLPEIDIAEKEREQKNDHYFEQNVEYVDQYGQVVISPTKRKQQDVHEYSEQYGQKIVKKKTKN